MSHDLRAPLRHISGFATLVQEKLGDGDEETNHFIARVTQAAAAMSVPIDDLLQFSRVGRAEMHVGKADMARQVREVIEVEQSELGERTAKVTDGEILPRWAIRRSCVRSGPISWATPSSTHDRATIETGSQREGDEVVYWVHDNGVGFDMKYQAACSTCSSGCIVWRSSRGRASGSPT